VWVVWGKCKRKGMVVCAQCGGAVCALLVGVASCRLLGPNAVNVYVQR